MSLKDEHPYLAPKKTCFYLMKRSERWGEWKSPGLGVLR